MTFEEQTAFDELKRENELLTKKVASLTEALKTEKRLHKETTNSLAESMADLFEAQRYVSYDLVDEYSMLDDNFGTVYDDD